MVFEDIKNIINEEEYSYDSLESKKQEELYL